MASKYVLTVGELQRLLNTFNPDYEVCISCDEDWYDIFKGVIVTELEGVEEPIIVLSALDDSEIDY